LEHLAEVHPAQVLHHDVRGPVGEGPDVEGVGDVLALDGGGGPRLAEEALVGLRDGGRVRAEELERHPLAEDQVPRRHHHAHPAPPAPRTSSTWYLPPRTSPGRGTSEGFGEPLPGSPTRPVSAGWPAIETRSGYPDRPPSNSPIVTARRRLLLGLAPLREDA